MRRGDEKSAWIGRTLRLDSRQWPHPREVKIDGMDDVDLAVIVRGDPPAFGETIKLFAAEKGDDSIWLSGEVVILERIRSGGRGVRVSLELVEPAERALARFAAEEPTKKPARSEKSSTSSLDDLLRAFARDEPVPELDEPEESDRTTPTRGQDAPRQRSISPDERRRKMATAETVRSRPELHASNDEGARRRRASGGGYNLAPDGERASSRRRRAGSSRPSAGDDAFWGSAEGSSEWSSEVPAEDHSGEWPDEPSAAEADARAAEESKEWGAGWDAETEEWTRGLEAELAAERREQTSGVGSGGVVIKDETESGRQRDDLFATPKPRPGGRADADLHAKPRPVPGETPKPARGGDDDDNDLMIIHDQPLLKHEMMAEQEAQAFQDALEVGLEDEGDESDLFVHDGALVDDLGMGQQKRVLASVKRHRRPKSGSGVRQVGAKASSLRKGASVIRERGTAPVVGIDFGTTYSKIALLDGDEVVLIEDEKSYSSTRAAIPSVVAISSTDEILVGESARELLAVTPERVISSVKRVIGLKFSDPLANGLLGTLACASMAGPNDSIVFDIEGNHLTVPDVAARVLDYVAGLASKWAGARVKRAVLTIPVDFDRDAQRELELAAKRAGIEIMALVPEPVAAVMGVGIDQSRDALVGVYDFGGGTFDASIVRVGEETFDVLGSAGDRWLGGDDIDELLARHVADIYAAERGIFLHKRQEEFQRLLFACEETKRLLSALDKVDVIMPNAGMTAEGPQVLMMPIERRTFDELAADVLASSLEVCRQAAFEAGHEPSEVDVLLITGGTSRVPVIHSGAERFFGRKGVEGIHPEHAVVIGAAIQAALEAGEPVPEDFAGRLKSNRKPTPMISFVRDDRVVEPVIDPTMTPPVTVHRVLRVRPRGQTSIRLEFVEGNNPAFERNRRLGNIIIEGIDPRAQSVIEFNLYFEYTTTGALHIFAQERESGLRAQTTIEV